LDLDTASSASTFTIGESIKQTIDVSIADGDPEIVFSLGRAMPLVLDSLNL